MSPANVDVVYVAPQGSCRKPANLDCGLNDTCAPCDLGAQGSARWRSGRTEQPRTNDAPWIVDEEILHDGAGADGESTLQVRLVDDCTASPASVLPDTNLACCAFLDCSNGGSGPGPQACFDYAQPTSCLTDCDALMGAALAQDCMARGPVVVRARLSTGARTRELCATMTDEQSLTFARVRRVGGTFTVSSLGSGVVEVAPGAPCP
ncbi:MAG: hypothetical protein FJ137_20560 [Deltaproteobacteria bacterium]|nr:hypothetical protein [Deltaproteobacteria bacterium]